MEKNENNKNVQNLIDEFLSKLKGDNKKANSDALLKAIRQLSKEHQNSVKSQKAEERLKEKEEQKKREKLAAENDKKKNDEHVEKVTCMDLPLDWENVFESDSRTQGVHVDSVADALVSSQRTLGRVDIEYMSAITGKDYKTVIESLGAAIYQNPETWNECFYKGWETADEYLTGNLSRKWNAAWDANCKYKGYFRRNLRALEEILPPTVATKDIYVTLGSPWVPADIIDDFIEYLLGKCRYANSPEYRVKHDELTGTWDIPFKTRYDDARSYSTYGTRRMKALYIIERTLNMRDVAVTDKVQNLFNKSGEKRVINKEETVLAIEKQKKIIQKFQSWIWTDAKRKERLEEIFENKFSCVRTRRFDGSFLNFPTMAKGISLYPYQKNAVARILFSKNTLLAHDVGSGKTYVMIAAGMELKRMGLSKKNLYVVPNNIVGQWQKIFLTAYPQAKLLCIEPKHFTPAKRQRVLKDIKDNDYDAIIMAYSCFDMIHLSSQYKERTLLEEKKIVDTIAKSSLKNTSGIERAKKKIKDGLIKLLNTVSAEATGICFDELGITRLFVDEAHNYKNVPIETQITRILGISNTGSEKCKSMLEKVKYVQRQNDGGGVVMATGTPITNSITDAYVMQKYLQSGELAALDLQSFDSWVGMFAERATEFEIDVDTNSYRLATRFSKFHNLPELTVLLSSIADFHEMRDSEELPKFDGYTDALIAKTLPFAAFLDQISQRADAVRGGLVRRIDDNMLKITTDGRKAALDLRLVDPQSKFTYQSKVARCAENVTNIYFKTLFTKKTQLVFCDTSTPKNGFNLYDELTALLVRNGVKREDIAFVHDAATDKQREELFKKVREGVIRVLIGSTFKLGLGVNVQDKLIAVHHLDVPWRPADMVQREGRILRQGNENESVQIFRYITEGSFDAYSWQLLETKQNFISSLLNGSLKQRSGSDVDNTVLNYAEVKALAIGNPLIKKRVETANELTRYLALQRKVIESRERLSKELDELPEKMEQANNRILDCREDMIYYQINKREYDKEDRKIIRQQIYQAVQENIMQEEEKTLLVYQGFEVVTPANMLREKPYVWLKRRGKYYVELGDTEMGSIVRIDNFLEDFIGLLTKLRLRLDDYKIQEERINEELEKNESYVDKIESLKQELEKIDKKLGVKKQ